MPARLYLYDGNRSWLPSLGGTLVPAPEPRPRLSLAQREALPETGHMFGPGDTGLLRGTSVYDLTHVEANAGGYIELSGPNPDSPDGWYRNLLFWGEVRIIGDGVKMVNCGLAGRDPYTYGATLDPLHRLASRGSLGGAVRILPPLYEFEVWDSLVDPALWGDLRLAHARGRTVVPDQDLQRLTAYAAGLVGGIGTWRRVEIRNVQDGMSWLRTRTDPEDTRRGSVRWCWLHSGTYYWGTDWASVHPETPDGPNSDGVHIRTGGEMDLWDNTIGGPSEVRVEEGRVYNVGESFMAAGVRVRQESLASTDPDGLHRIRRLSVRRNVIWPVLGTGWHRNHPCIDYSLNIDTSANYPNDLADCEFVGNLFPRHPQGKYIICPPEHQDLISDSHVVDVDRETWTYTLAESAPIQSR